MVGRRRRPRVPAAGWNRRFVWVDVMAPRSRAQPAQAVSGAKPLATGDRIAVEVDEGKFDIWMLDIERQSLTKVTSDGASRYPMWTPDGAHIGVAQRREDNLLWCPASGGERRRWCGREPEMDRIVDAGHATLIYMQEHPKTRSDLWVVDLQDNNAATSPRPDKGSGVRRTAVTRRPLAGVFLRREQSE